MKNTQYKAKLIKRSVSVFAGLLIGFCSPMLIAQQQPGNLSGFSGAGAQDNYVIACPEPATRRLELAISDDTAAGALITVLGKSFTADAAAVTSDPIGGDALFSPPAIIQKGSGDYFVSISQTAAASQNYTLDYTCRDAGGVILSSQIHVLENQ